jgi:hypothetical protein
MYSRINPILVQFKCWESSLHILHPSHPSIYSTCWINNIDMWVGEVLDAELNTEQEFFLRVSCLNMQRLLFQTKYVLNLVITY